MTWRRTTFAVAATFLLAGCAKEPPVSVENATEATIANLEAQANALEAKAADQVNEAGAQDVTNAQAAFDADAARSDAAVANTL